jgi:hypothetical protein
VPPVWPSPAAELRHGHAAGGDERGERR